MTVPAATPTPLQRLFSANRNVFIAASVLVFHALAIWALQTGLLMRTVEILVPVELLAQIIDLPAPRVTPEPPKPPTPPMPVKQTVTKPAPVSQPAPRLLAVPDAAPSPIAPAPQALAPVAPSVPFVPAVPVVAVPAPAAPAKVELPSSDADYLSNPKPPYPPMSKRLGEQGKTVVRVLIGIDGLPQKAELRQSSGFERLDQSALATVMKWRYVPGKRGGVPETMWFNVPVSFVLE
ncbi:MAG: TonB family protein [Burkholderiaceae bacterium]|nr:TonB family protein [Burkholderiaceae bacterium]